MQANLIGAVKTNRRKTQLGLCRVRCALDGPDRSSFVAADEFDVPVNDHLWCVNAPEAKVTRVSALPFAVFVRGEGILPSDIVPIVHIFTQDDEVRAVWERSSLSNRASAGGQLEQPSDVNNSTSTGAREVSSTVGLDAVPAA